jgi:DinB superfamily
VGARYSATPLIWGDMTPVRFGMIGVRNVAAGVPDLLSAQRLDCAPRAVAGIPDCGDPGAAPPGERVASRVDHDGYAEQRPDDVAHQLTVAAQLLARVLGRLSPDDWGRSVMDNYPQRAERSLRWVALHTLHEVSHHLLDARRQLA